MIIKIDWSLDSGVNMGNFQTERWISDSRQRFGSACFSGLKAIDRTMFIHRIWPGSGRQPFATKGRGESAPGSSGQHSRAGQSGARNSAQIARCIPGLNWEDMK